MKPAAVDRASSSCDELRARYGRLLLVAHAMTVVVLKYAPELLPYVETEVRRRKGRQ